MAKERRETKYRKRRTSILCGILAVLVSAVAVVTACTVFFRVESVAVEGNERYSAEEILAAAAIELGSNLPLTAGELLQDRICTTLPYIESVKVEKHLPTRLVLVVKEAPPIAVVAQEAPAQDLPPENGEDPGEDPEADQAGPETSPDQQEAPEESDAEPEAEAVQGGYWLLDAKARLLEPVDESGGVGYIQIKGITAVEPEKGRTMQVLQGYEGQLEALIRLLQAVQERGLGDKVTEIDVSSPTEVDMLYDGRLRVTMLINADFSRKMVIFSQIADLLGDGRQGTVNLKTTDAYFTPGGV